MIFGITGFAGTVLDGTGCYISRDQKVTWAQDGKRKKKKKRKGKKRTTKGTWPKEFFLVASLPGLRLSKWPLLSSQMIAHVQDGPNEMAEPVEARSARRGMWQRIFEYVVCWESPLGLLFCRFFFKVHLSCRSLKDKKTNSRTLSTADLMPQTVANVRELEFERVGW